MRKTREGGQRFFGILFHSVQTESEEEKKIAR